MPACAAASGLPHVAPCGLTSMSGLQPLVPRQSIKLCGVVLCAACTVLISWLTSLQPSKLPHEVYKLLQHGAVTPLWSAVPTWVHACMLSRAVVCRLRSAREAPSLGFGHSPEPSQCSPAQPCCCCALQIAQRWGGTTMDFEEKPRGWNRKYLEYPSREIAHHVPMLAGESLGNDRLAPVGALSPSYTTSRRRCV